MINSHNGWDQLEEVWLGDVYPASWYDHLDSEIRDVFHRLTELTQQDLACIQKILESFGVTVQRPVYNSIDDFVDSRGLLAKPQICPRDHFLVTGNTLFGHKWQTTAWQTIIDSYIFDQQCKFEHCESSVNGANVVRVGRDLIFDQGKKINPIPVDYTRWHNYRIQKVSNGGHLDGCFSVLRPGLLLASHYFDEYEKTFPGWEIIMLDNPTYQGHVFVQPPYPPYNGKFWNTAVGTNKCFNQYVIKHALDWVGCYTETYFELNCLMINKSNVIMLEKNEPLAETLSAHGITVHWVPFKTRSFWDGAMHCLTLDVRRQSQIENYFPERGQ